MTLQFRPSTGFSMKTYMEIAIADINNERVSLLQLEVNQFLNNPTKIRLNTNISESVIPPTYVCARARVRFEAP